MPTLRLPPDLFVPLCEAVAIATNDPLGRLERTGIQRVRRALAGAAAHSLPGLPLLAQLELPDLALLAARFEAGVEQLGAISEAQHHDIAELLGQAAWEGPRLRAERRAGVLAR